MFFYLIIFTHIYIIYINIFFPYLYIISFTRHHLGHVFSQNHILRHSCIVFHQSNLYKSLFGLVAKDGLLHQFTAGFFVGTFHSRFNNQQRKVKVRVVTFLLSL